MTSSPARTAVVQAVARHLATRDVGHPLRVGIDGIVGAGKSTFTRDLTVAIRALGRPAVHVDSDGFHHVRAVRHRQGRASARGYYEDAYDLDAVRKHVLVPCGAGAPHRIATRVHDLATDEVVRDWTVVPSEAAVLFDATFLQRGRLRELWDDVVYLDVRREVARARGVARDAAALGGTRAAEHAYTTRYLAAWDLYAEQERPYDRADIVVGHDDPQEPVLVRLG